MGPDRDVRPEEFEVMTFDKQDLVRSSFAAVAPNAAAVSAMFYARLFELNPTLRPLFKRDMAAQGRKLMAMIATAVANLHDLDAVIPDIEQLGRRHVGYGVTDQDYDTVGSALLWTLEQGLGEAFTPATRAAWAECYVTLAGVMQQAAQTTANH
jgi:hemoglobin-like flavoprotein